MMEMENQVFKTKPFADRKGVFVLIVRKSNNKVVGKIPFTTEKQTKQKVRRRMQELRELDKITDARIRKTKELVGKGVMAGRRGATIVFNLINQKPKRKKRKKKRGVKRGKTKKKR